MLSIAKFLLLSKQNCSGEVKDLTTDQVLNKIKLLTIDTSKFTLSITDINNFLFYNYIVFINGDSLKNNIFVFQKDFFYKTTKMARLCIDTNQIAWIFFQGTVSKDEMLQNINVKQVDYHGLNAHGGFVNILTSFDDEILEILQKKQITTVIFMGHSLGGALASLFSTRLTSYKFYCIAMASPKSGDYVKYNTKIPTNCVFIDIFNSMDNVPFIIPPLITLNDVTYSFSQRSILEDATNNLLTKVIINFDYNCTSLNHSISEYAKKFGIDVPS